VGTLQAKERDTLLEELAGFVRADPKPFYLGAIVLPSEAFFPEQFTADADGLARIGTHLLAYVHLDERYGIDVTLGEGATGSKAMLPATRVDFACIENDRVFLSCTALARADDALFAATQEIARAAMLERRARTAGVPYREGLPSPVLTPTDSEVEKHEASVYAMYVGLGVIATAGAHQYRQAGRIQGRQTVAEWMHVTYGALEPEDASFLLAVQLVVRGIDGERREAMLACLPEDRRTEVLAEIEGLEREALIAELGLPPVAEWEAEEILDPAPALPPLPPPETDDDDEDEDEDEPTTQVFRVRRANVIGGAIVGVLGGLFLGIALRVALFPASDATGFLFGLTAVGAILGVTFGGQSGSDECSDCERTIPADATRCASCKRTIAGRIPHRSMRLDARAALQRRR